VGSYPQLQRGVTISLIGDDEQKVMIRQIGEEVCAPNSLSLTQPDLCLQVAREIQGTVVGDTAPKVD
jgi:hypothetical protein